MKRLLIAALIVAAADAAPAGEMFSGTHTYRAFSDEWLPVPAAGYRSIRMVGAYAPISGPIPAGPIECRGTNFWSKSVVEADGVCVFGEGADTWMLRYRMTSTDRAARSVEEHKRMGEWTVVGGTGRYSGLKGSGTYLAERDVAEGGMFRTRWEGEVAIPR